MQINCSTLFPVQFQFKFICIALFTIQYFFQCQPLIVLIGPVIHISLTLFHGDQGQLLHISTILTATHMPLTLINWAYSVSKKDYCVCHTSGVKPQRLIITCVTEVTQDVTPHTGAGSHAGHSTVSTPRALQNPTPKGCDLTSHMLPIWSVIAVIKLPPYAKCDNTLSSSVSRCCEDSSPATRC